MSIESNLKSIAESLKEISAKLDNNIQLTAAPAADQVPAAPVAPVLNTPPPVPPTAAAPAAPAAPTSVAPFNTVAEMKNYVMTTYNELGAEKGGQIQAVLSGIGCSNINEVTEAQFGDLYSGIEALKVA